MTESGAVEDEISLERVPSVLGPSAAMAVALATCKAILLGRPESPLWCRDLIAITWQDVVWVTAYAIFGWLALRQSQRRSRLQRSVWRLFLVLGAVSIAYAIVHVGFYQSFRRAINVQMLRFAGDTRNLWSSVGSRLTWPYLTSLASVPLGFGLLFRRPKYERRSSFGRSAAFLFAAAWMLAGHAALGSSAEEWKHRLAENPHLTLLSSAALELRGRRSVDLPRDVRNEDVQEFKTIAERPRPHDTPARIRNVILIVLESTGARYMRLYGSPYDTTPTLVAEAANSLVVDHFYAHVGYTFCSFMALNFSRYPGLPWCYLPCGERPLPQTLPGLLRARGYRTAFLTSGDANYEGLGYMAENNGFAVVRDHASLGCASISSWGATDECAFDGIVRFIDEDASAPFYVMAWTDQTHDPYVLPPGSPTPDLFSAGDRRDDDLGRYLSILRQTDAEIGRLLGALRQRALADDTLVVITGDHGEAFGSPHDYRGHGAELYEENVWVPLVLWNPRIFRNAGRSAHVGAHVDLNPTVAELLGVAPVGGWQGASLFDDTRPDRAFFFTGVSEFQFGMRDTRYKYIYNATFGREHLFDVQQDPDELVDLSTRDSERALLMRRRTAGWVWYEDKMLMGAGPQADEGPMALPARLP